MYSGYLIDTVDKTWRHRLQALIVIKCSSNKLKILNQSQNCFIVSLSILYKISCIDKKLPHLLTNVINFTMFWSASLGKIWTEEELFYLKMLFNGVKVLLSIWIMNWDLGSNMFFATVSASVSERIITWMRWHQR